MRKLPSLRKEEPDPEPPETPAPPPPAPRSWPRFGTKSMLLAMFLLAVASAVYGGLRVGADRTFYVIFATATPVLVLLVAGLLHQWIQGKRRRR